MAAVLQGTRQVQPTATESNDKDTAYGKTKETGAHLKQGAHH